MLNNCCILCCSKLRRNKSMTICMRKFSCETNRCRGQTILTEVLFPALRASCAAHCGSIRRPSKAKDLSKQRSDDQNRVQQHRPPHQRPGATRRQRKQYSARLAASDLSVPHACLFRAWPRSYAAPPSQSLHRCSDDDTNLQRTRSACVNVRCGAIGPCKPLLSFQLCMPKPFLDRTNPRTHC